MAATFTTTQSPASSDYFRYLWDGSVKKTDRYKDATLLDFSLAPVDGNFVKLSRGSYITIDTATYPKWFTGYITNDPELSYLGVKGGQPAWGYKYQATSDEYLLSLKPIGLMPTFMNVSLGFILKALANKLAPGIFDVTNVDDGPLVAQYNVDPEKKFQDIVKDFCEIASFNFWAKEHKLYFQSQDTTTITLDGNDPDFTPARLDIKPSASPVINDVTALGDIEPQAYVTEYFLGTGLDAAFPLIASVFGADSSVLIDEQFQGSTINGSLWDVNDVVPGYLQVSNGYLNILGGADVSLSSVNPIPLDGRLRLTHGEWDFLSGTGIIGGLWTAAPSGGLTGLVYGLKYTGGNLYACISGAVDTSTAIIPIDTAKRYVLRTLAEFKRSNRYSQTYSYIDQSGTRGTYGGAGTDDIGSFATIVTEIDPTNGTITNQWTLKSEATFDDSSSYAKYVPVYSTDIHATVTGITVSVPLNATLEMATRIVLDNLGFDQWDAVDTPTGWDFHTNVFQETTFYNSGVAGAKFQAGAGGSANAAQLCNDFVQPNTTYTISVRVARTLATTSGNLSLGFTSAFAPFTAFFMQVPVSSMNSDGTYKTFTGTYTTPSVLWSDTEFLVLFNAAVPNVGAIYIDDIQITTQWEGQLIGPNEVDASDGLAPVATIVGGNIGQDTKSTLTGASQFNPGQYQLVFFKDSVTRNSNIPPENQLIKLTYRAAGPAIGRSISRASIMQESQSWLDDGVRSIVKRDLSPRPRSSAECEMAAAAIVSENAFVHYEGSYKQFSTYFSAEPMSGNIIQFTNLSNMAPVTAEEVHEVATTMECMSPELFLHTVTFGKPDHIRKLLERFDAPQGAFQKSSSTTPNPVDAGAIGLAFAPDVVAPVLVAWDNDNLFMDTGQDLAGTTFEVRYTDEGWGADDGKNLVTRTTSRTFSVPRSLRGRVFFVRQAIAGNLILYSEDQSQSNYTPAATMSNKMNPEGDISSIGTLTMAVNDTFDVSATGTGTVFSFSIKGTAGKRVKVTFGATNQTYKLTGFWQRISVTGSASSATLTALDADTWDVTRFSMEASGTVETAYVKTNDVVYGPVSRYSAAVHVSFPVGGLNSSFFQHDRFRFIVWDTTPGAYSNILDARSTGTFDICTVEITDTPTTDCTVDVLLNGTSIFGATKLVIPGGATSQLKRKTFASTGLRVTKDDSAQLVVIDGDGSGFFTVTPSWVMD